MLKPQKTNPRNFAGVSYNTAPDLKKSRIFTMQLFSLFNVLGKWGCPCLRAASFLIIVQNYLADYISRPIFATPKTFTNEDQRAFKLRRPRFF